MRILIATTQLPLVKGGAEFHAEGLAEALCAAGHGVDIVKIPYVSRTPEQMNVAIEFCLRLDLNSCAGTKVDRLIGLKFPAYLIPHSGKVQWILHQSRKLYDLWSGAFSRIKSDSRWIEMREMVHKLDTELIPKARAVYTNSMNVTNRLRQHNGIESTPLYHPPPLAHKFHCESAEEYFLFPSRIVDHKRQELVIEALSKTKHPVKVVFTGVGDNVEYGAFVERRSHEYKVNGRCTWLGWVSEEEKIRLYAHCLGVVYPPYDEDLGYVTLESMLAEKPVITCADSGGPLEFIRNEESGLVCDPTPEGIASAMDCLWGDRSLAARMGREGRKRYLDLNLTWDAVVETLLK
jgi:glycosyltransferase involved in cell wall biosynthesis